MESSDKGKKANLSKEATETKSSVEDSQAGHKASPSKTTSEISNSDQDSSSTIKPNENKTSAAMNPSKEVLPNTSKQNEVKEKKSSDEESTEYSEVDSDQDENSLLFDEEPSKELMGKALSFSSSDCSTNKSKLSFRKISMEVASSLPLENNSDESEEDDDVETKSQAITTSLSEESEPVISSTVTSMTKEQIEEHISCCLQLNTENKINTKNAFALKLIDCMTVKMKTANDESNFAAVACQLDAGAKIYSNRVDAVHQQVLKLAESCLFAEKKSKNKKDDNEDDDDNNKESTGEISEKARRRKAKKKILAAPEQITRKLKGKDPRENYVQLEARPGGILDKARRDPKDLSLTLEKHVPFWHDGPGTSVGGFVKIPKIELKSREITPGLDMKSLLKYLPSEHLPSPQVSTSEDNEIPQPSPPSDCESPEPPAWETLENDNDEIDEDIKLPEESSQGLQQSNELNIVSLAESRMSEQMATKPTRLDVIKALFHTEGESDYNYLKMDSKEYWAGPSYWKYPQGVSAAAYKKKTIRKKKEPIEIDYSDESAKSKELIVSLKRTTQLSKRTMANWSKKKVTYPTDIQFQPQTFFQLFHVETTVSHSDDEDPKKQEESDLPNEDIQDEGDDFVDTHADSSGEDNPLPLSEITQQIASNTVDETPMEVIPSETEEEAAGPSNPIPASSDDVYEGDNLVPMVKMVQVEPIRCVPKPNRVDFQHLKQVMLAVIQESIEDKENQDSTGTFSGSVAFKDVLQVLFNSNRLHHRTREDLSVAMAFLCLLTLTNEHSFNLIQAENSATEDIIISYETNDGASMGQSSSLTN